MLDLYTTDFVLHFLSSGHPSFFRKLQGCGVLLSLEIGIV